MFALGSVLFVGLAALTIDLGRGFMAKKELQNVADASVLAAGRELGRIYERMTYDEQQNYIMSGSDHRQIMDVVNQVAQKNHAGGSSIGVNQADILIGQWDRSTNSLTATTIRPDAIRILTRRDQEANAPVTTHFAGILGFDNLKISTTATGALTPIGMAPPGELDAPVAIATRWYVNGGGCGDPITFEPVGGPSGCAAWHTFLNAPATPNKVKSIIQEYEAGTFESPETTAGKTYFQMRGVLPPSAFEDFLNLYNAKKDATGGWKIFMPIYEQDDCKPANGPRPIVGFATAIVTVVETLPTPLIQATVICDVVEMGRGGGPSYGTKGSIPGIVS